MLFFYGTKTSTIGRYPLFGVACAHCGTPDSLFVTVYARYLHLFWIPVLPLGKNTVSQCAHCQQALAVAQMPPAYRGPALAWQQQARRPLAHYLVLAPAAALLAVVLAGGVVAAFHGFQSARDTKAFLAAPRVGDFYALRNPDRHYNVLRVARVAPDTLYFEACAYRPRNLADVSARQDSLLRSRAPGVQPQPHAAVQAWQRADILTVVRP